VILRDETPPTACRDAPRAGNDASWKRPLPYAQYRGSGSRSPGLKPLFEHERLAVEWFLIPSWVESHEGALGLQLPGVDGVGELELEEAPDLVDASAAMIDSQSVKTTEDGGRSNGYDAHKNIKGRKRHLLVDTLGFPLSVYVTPANVHDRVGTRCLLADLVHNQATSW
jgi:hypothetical protein